MSDLDYARRLLRSRYCAAYYDVLVRDPDLLVRLVLPHEQSCPAERRAALLAAIKDAGLCEEQP